MTQRTLRRALSAAAVCAAIPALAPAVAAASTYTVDDDRAQCANAGFTSIQAAVDQAAPWDTIVVCDGLYEEQSTPSSGSESPSQSGSRNGLTITKPLTIKGAGAAKVTIRPASSLTTLEGTAPYLRDGGGNVITVSKQSRDATDLNTMFVDISGVTVDSPNTWAEAGIAFFDASGAVRNSVVGPLRRDADSTELAAHPHGWGIVATNHYQGAEAGPRREITVANSLVTGYQTGGILFDDARGTDGSPESLLRSGIVSYGYVRESTVTGAGPTDLFPQTGVEYHAGQRGSVTRSTITGNYFRTDPRRSVGVLATDAETRADPAAPTVPGLSVYQNILTANGYALFNADAANSAVRTGAPLVATPGALGLENWFGCAAGPVIGGPSAGEAATNCQGVSGADSASAASITLGANRPSAPSLPAAPGAVTDDAPTASFGEPVTGAVTAGVALDPVVLAGDDFGVRSVTLSLDGAPVGDKAAGPYEFSGAWTPAFDEIGETHELSATVTDSSGKTTTTSAEVTVVAPAGYVPASLDSGSAAFGSVTVGETATRTITVTNSGRNPLTLDTFAVAGSGFAVTGGTCTANVEYAAGALCTVIVSYAPTAAGAATGTLTLPYTAIGGGEPLVVALSGAGVARAPETREPATREPETRDPVVTPPALVAPVSTSMPTVGAAHVGRAVTCAPGGWSGEPTSFAYGWLRDGVAISGANGAAYTPVLADTGASLTCVVVAANAAGAGAAATSAAVTVAFATVTTKTTVAKQLNAAIVTFTKAPKAKRGTLTPATVRSYGSGSATFKATGTLKVGAARFALSATRSVASGKRASFALKLSAKARKALAKRGGTLTLKVADGRAATSQKLSVKRG